MKSKHLFLLRLIGIFTFSACVSSPELVTYEESVQETLTPTLSVITPVAVESSVARVVERKIDLWNGDTPMLRGVRGC